MKIGIVCPYSFDAPGGVQVHILDLAQELRRRGHEVSVLAPGESANYRGVTLTGSGYKIRYNGSVAPLSLTRKSWQITQEWLNNGKFEVVHVHEPLAPSISLFTLLKASVPIVATHHTATVRSLAMQTVSPLVRRWIRACKGRIAVSNEARRTLIEHLGEDAVIIPNGVFTSSYREAQAKVEWEQTPQRPVFSFLGRLDEARKGLPVLLKAIPLVLARYPQARFLIAGRGEAPEAKELQIRYPENIELLGGVSDEEKAALFAGSTAYIAPQTGGESFGIVLVEAMAAGTLVVASDIEAFRLVLDDGKYGKLFHTGNPQDLADTLCAALENKKERDELAKAGQLGSQKFDWATVTNQIEEIYKLAALQSQIPAENYETRAKLLRSLHENAAPGFKKHALRKHYNQLVRYLQAGKTKNTWETSDYAEEHRQ
ncbi:glycosyltransferase, group 1 family protein [Gleimia coleocanis DSM 15436]|uniref:Glycosyltransferase, group 1 family protein n=1 Tax=Gleimia coleocanis DSM 15436 TaxID=525245 RepID=C0W1Q7_9ACTO|nr:glycosyltransferase family 4 protein [Gleimia coleocanis]EEH63423.1 glycosyltransferase, group 1 family protein [Gleimia coleocanis DSM 15436]